MISYEYNVDRAAREAPIAVAQELGSKVIPWAVERTPQTDPTAEVSSSTCITRLERPPYGVKSVMINPARTEVQTTGTYGAVPGCDSFQRIAQHRTQIKDHGHWRGIEGNGWYPVIAQNEKAPFSLLDFATTGVKEKKVHGHWEPAREQFRVIVRDHRTGKVISRGKITNKSVQIEG